MKKIKKFLIKREVEMKKIKFLWVIFIITPLFSISGPVSGTWGPDEIIYVDGDIWVPSGETLTILEGTQVRFQGGYWFTVESNATLIINGIENNKVILTSDDFNTYGYWYGLVFYSGTINSSLNHCIIEYSGEGFAGALYLGEATLNLTNLTIQNSRSWGIYAEWGTLNVQNLTISECVLDGIILTGGYIYPSGTITIHHCGGVPMMFLDPNNVMDFNPVIVNFQFYNNGDDVFYVGAGEITRTGTWYNHGYPYVIGGGGIIINPGYTLTIESGNILKVDVSYLLNPQILGTEIYGTLIAQGTSSQPIIFTSYFPGTYWSGLYFGEGGEGVLEHCIIEYGAGEFGPGQGTIHLNSSGSVSISNTEIRYSQTNGIYISASSPFIYGCIIKENGQNGVYVASGSPVVRNSSVLQNSAYGIYIESGTPDLGTCENPGNNTIKDNFGAYDVYNATANEIWALYNTWFSTDPYFIDSRIYDDEEDPLKGIVHFIPFTGELLYGSTAFNNATRLFYGPYFPAYQGVELGYTGVDGNIYFTHSPDAQNWATPILLGSGKYPGMVHSPFPANLVAVWTWKDNSTGYEYLKMTYRKDGVEWQPPVTLFSTQGTSYRVLGAPSISFDGAYWWVTWSALRDLLILPYPAFQAYKVLLVGKFSQLDGSDFQWQEIDSYPVLIQIPIPSPQIPRPVPVETLIIDTVTIVAPVPMSPSIDASWGENDIQLLWERLAPDGLHTEIYWYEYENGNWFNRGIISNDDDKTADMPKIEIFNDYAHAIWQEIDPVDGIQKIWWRQRHKTEETWGTLRCINPYTTHTSFDPVILKGTWALWTEEYSQNITELWGSTKFLDYWTDPVQVTFTGGISLYPQMTFKPIFAGQNPEILRVAPDTLIFAWIENVCEQGAIFVKKMPTTRLMYYQVALGKEMPSPYTVQRDSFISYGTEWYKNVDIHPNELIYHFENFNPLNEYILELVFYYEGNSPDWKMMVFTDQVSRGVAHLENGDSVLFWKKIPKNVYSDGKIDIKIKKIRGDFAVLSGIFIREFPNPPENSGGIQNAGIISPIRKLMLYPGKPNPFKDKTIISYQLPEQAEIELSIYDVSGKKIITLEKGKKSGGFYRVHWNGKDDKGKGLPSGIYFVTLKTEKRTVTQKLIKTK